MAEQEGKWVTLENGVHLFIKKGQTLDDAIEQNISEKPKQDNRTKVLEKNGVNTKNLSDKEKEDKYNELGGDKNWANKAYGEEEDIKDKENKNSTYKRKTDFESNQDIDWDLAEENEKINGKNAKNPKRHDKYGNELLSDEAFKIGQEAGKSYLEFQAKYGRDLSKNKKNNALLSGLSEVITNAITNNGFDPNQNITYSDINQIIGSITGEEVDMEKFELQNGSGFTGRKYIDYQPKK